MSEEEAENHDPHFEPLVHLPPVEIKTLEEDEDEYCKLRAKLFRYDSVPEPPEWKERGTGDVKILQHRDNKTCRILMRRDKTMKICANHYVLPHMELKPNCGSERAWVWSTPADFADEEAKSELLAIRFANVENAQKFKTAFEKAQDQMKETLKQQMKKGKNEVRKSSESSDKTEEDADKVANKLKELNVNEKDIEEKKTKDIKAEDGKENKSGEESPKKTIDEKSSEIATPAKD